MNLKVITVVSDTDNPGHKELIRSLQYFGYEYDVMIKPFEFGGQMKHIYEWCKSNWGWFLYTDGWDTFALSDKNEIEAAISQPNFPKDVKCIFSAEKNCYPLRETAAIYPKCGTEWQYVNGGGLLCDCEYFVNMYEDGLIDKVHERNDQQWLAEQYIKRHASGEVALDSQCYIFQTIAFENTWDFGRVSEQIEDYKNGWKDRLRLINKHTNSLPVFIHGNAHTPMAKIWRLL